MDFSGCRDDGSLGPAVRGCRDDFDFTITFESIVFALIPTSVFVALCAPRILYLTRRPVLVGGALLRGAKLTAIAVLACLQLSLLVLSSSNAGRFRPLLAASAALALASAICMAWLSFLEHSRSPRPSIFLNAYLFVSILLQVAQARTFWLASISPAETIFSRLFTTAVALKALILVLESRHKSRWILWDVKDHSPEETSGFFGLGVFAWLNRLFLRGYRRVLSLEDLYPLDHQIHSEVLRSKLEHHVNALSERPGQKHGLAKALAKSLAVELTLPVGPRIAMGVFQLCQPFLINALLEYLQQPSKDPNFGYGLIGATILIYTGIAISSAFYWYFQERAVYMARGALGSAIYQKTVNIKLSADDTAALTLMSTDIEQFMKGTLRIHEIWANIIQVGVACWLLSTQIGAAFVAPLIVVGFCVACLTVISRYTGPRQKLWMEKLQKRVGMTSKVIGQMKYLKMSGLAQAVQDSIQAMRVDELRTGANFRFLLTLSLILGYTPLCISPVVTFAFAGQTLGVTKIFTSISYILLLATPLGSVFQAIPQLLAAFTCLTRIQEFLEDKSREDFRQPTRSPKTVEEEQLPNNGQAETGGEDGPIVKIIDGSFGWQDNAWRLENIDLTIARSRLTIIVGPVASGKSTLCKALLGETPVFQGHLIMQPGAGYHKVGYCDQTPFLTNATIRENIVGFAPFNEERYNEVIEASMLRHDVDVLLPQGDQTEVGSNGITLSGGQKQRVAIARALYLESSLLIFDDVFSGLDNDTEEQVFRRLFSAEGLLRRRSTTVVLCTHSVRHITSADHIVALGPDESGTASTIVEQGAFTELMANKKYVYSLDVKESAVSRSEDSPELENTDKAARLEVKQPTRPKTSGSSATQEERERMLGDASVYKHYLSRLNKPSIVIFLISTLGWGFFSNFTTVWLTFWSDDVTSAQPTHSNSFYLGLYALFQISILVSLFFSSWVISMAMVPVSGARLHQDALSTVINATLRFFTTTDTGKVTNLFSQDMNLLDGQLPLSMCNLALYIFSCIGMAAVIASSSPFVVVTYPALVFILYGIQKFYLRTSRQIRLLDLETKSPLYSHFIDTMKGITTIRALGWVPDSVRMNNHLLDASQRPAYLLAMIQRWLGLTLQLVVAALAFVVVTLATQVGSSVGVTGASLVTLMSFGEALSIIVTMYTLLETSIGAVSRLKSFGDNVKSESLEGETVKPPPEWPTRGHIAINGVSASYLGPENEVSQATISDDQDGNDVSSGLALRDLTLDIKPGEKVAICGRSGSGKSSLILLLLRLLDPLPSSSPSSNNNNNSKITIDGTPLGTIDRRTLRQRIITVPQDTVFLPDGTSFRSNLDLAVTDGEGEGEQGQRASSSSSSEADCRAVLAKVGLWALVERQGGLDAGMYADALSQGQKQLFSIARAILRRRAREGASGGGVDGGERKEGGEGRGGGILLLDEVSSSVDRATDRAIQQIIRDEFDGYTIVMVSHRLDVVMDFFDTVVVLDRGSVVETGDPRRLVGEGEGEGEREREGSRFRDLWLIGNNNNNRE
ncbi:P-loop containing nucleoside triphosphate hydrolase protein [Xylariomycetidae sp. FL2044]|nr:P-loop containing nucleoside triphosphate hydrolase protein [Xylariomycetidae sp. FL2044]